jgi:dihydrofolate synthase/folylpolyglutamate synthase
MSRATQTRRRGGRSSDRSPGEIVTYPNAVRFLHSRMDHERMRLIRINPDEAFKLDRMRTLMEELGNPQDQVRTVHIGGTVGKGSTVAMIASMLQGCGYAVGQYTSPHLVDVRERVAINGVMIGRPEFTELMRQVAQAAAKLELDATFFELVTAIAFLHFAEQAVDVAIIETGLGGRLDSTNIITPEVTAITRIDFDHQQLLGESLEQIAAEKAGLFKRGVPVLSVKQSEEVDAVLRAKAEEVEAPIRVIGDEIEFSCRFSASPDLGPHSRVCVVTETSRFMHLPVPIPGEHQAVNCGVALGVIDALRGVGFECPEVPMLDGLNATVNPGSMELVWDQPRILVDGAHNSAAPGALMRCVGVHVAYDSMVCVFGCCEDKDIPAMLEKVATGRRQGDLHQGARQPESGRSR